MLPIMDNTDWYLVASYTIILPHFGLQIVNVNYRCPILLTLQPMEIFLPNCMENCLLATQSIVLQILKDKLKLTFRKSI